MLRNLWFKVIPVIALVFSTIAFAADTPTIHQVYEAAQAGRLNEAQGMIQQVLKEHPNSAKAHYVDAEILAKQGHLGQARSELNAAEKLEPGLPFAKPQAVQELRSLVAGTSSYTAAAPMAAAPAQHVSFPWGLVLLGIGLIIVIGLIVRALSNRNNPSVVYTGGPGYGYQPGMGGQPMPGGSYGVPPSSGMGGGIMGGLATGAALGAGMVAGEALAHHFIDGNNPPQSGMPPADNNWNAQPQDNMGGNDFGISDNSSWDDNSDIADISGGDDWT